MKANSFTFSCPACGQHIAASASDVGANADCPSCNAELVVPDQTVTEPPSYQKACKGRRNPLLVPLVTVSGLLVVAVTVLLLHMSSGASDRKGRRTARPATTESSALPDSSTQQAPSAIDPIVSSQSTPTDLAAGTVSDAASKPPVKPLSATDPVPSTKPANSPTTSSDSPAKSSTEPPATPTENISVGYGKAGEIIYGETINNGYRFPNNTLPLDRDVAFKDANCAYVIISTQEPTVRQIDYKDPCSLCDDNGAQYKFIGYGGGDKLDKSMILTPPAGAVGSYTERKLFVLAFEKPKVGGKYFIKGFGKSNIPLELP